MLLPLGAALLALAAALAGYVMVKFFGVIFLGQPREPTLATCPRCGHCGAARPRMACARLRAARLVSRSHCHCDASAWSPGSWAWAGCRLSDAPWWLLRADSRAAVLVRTAGVLCRDHGRGGAGHLRRAPLLSPARAQGRRLGLRLRRPQQPHAGHRRRIRSADSASVSTVLRHRAGSCRAPSTRAPTYRLEIGDRIWLALVPAVWARWCGGWPTRWPGCSRAALRLICSTAS